jgi:hypothetical protein
MLAVAPCKATKMRRFFRAPDVVAGDVQQPQPPRTAPLGKAGHTMRPGRRGELGAMAKTGELLVTHSQSPTSVATVYIITLTYVLGWINEEARFARMRYHEPQVFPTHLSRTQRLALEDMRPRCPPRPLMCGAGAPAGQIALA